MLWFLTRNISRVLIDGRRNGTNACVLLNQQLSFQNSLRTNGPFGPTRNTVSGPCTHVCWTEYHTLSPPFPRFHTLSPLSRVPRRGHILTVVTCSRRSRAYLLSRHGSRLPSCTIPGRPAERRCRLGRRRASDRCRAAMASRRKCPLKVLKVLCTRLGFSPAGFCIPARAVRAQICIR